MTGARRIIALAGLSGAGKTTLIRRVADQATLVHLSASDLIKAQIKLENEEERTSEALRSGNIPYNQDRLVTAFTAIAQSLTKHIILDCHTVIDTPVGIQRIPVEVFRAIEITDFIFLVLTQWNSAKGEKKTSCGHDRFGQQKSWHYNRRPVFN